MADMPPSTPTPTPWERTTKLSQDVYYIGRALGVVTAGVIGAYITIWPKLAPYASHLTAFSVAFVPLALVHYGVRWLRDTEPEQLEVKTSLFGILLFMTMVLGIFEVDKVTRRDFLVSLDQRLAPLAMQNDDIRSLAAVLKEERRSLNDSMVNALFYLVASELYLFQLLMCVQKRFRMASNNFDALVTVLAKQLAPAESPSQTPDNTEIHSQALPAAPDGSSA